MSEREKAPVASASERSAASETACNTCACPKVHQSSDRHQIHFFGAPAFVPELAGIWQAAVQSKGLENDDLIRLEGLEGR